MTLLPPAAQPFHDFSLLLRRHGFSVAPEQIFTFMRAVALLGPRSMGDILQAAHASLAPPPDRRSEFEAHFRSLFYGERPAKIAGETEDDPQIKDQAGREKLNIEATRQAQGGELSSRAEQLGSRNFDSDGNSLAAFRRMLPGSLPKRRRFRYVRTQARGTLDIRRSFRRAVHTDGDIVSPLLRRRQTVSRQLLVLIDVSGSMKAHTPDYLKLCHDVVQSRCKAEIFTFGTRLTRITASLRIRDRERALADVAAQVEDWDGGTRIGPTLLAFLSVPRFAALARGAAIVLLTDGLERGDHSDMETAIRRLGARAFRLSLCTPLAGDPRFRPATAALRAILPLLDDLADGSSIEQLSRFLLSLARQAPSAERIWQEVS